MNAGLIEIIYDDAEMPDFVVVGGQQYVAPEGMKIKRFAFRGDRLMSATLDSGHKCAWSTADGWFETGVCDVVLAPD